MNLIDAKFASLKREGRSALMPFITVGDPDLDTTLELIKEMERAGADMIELGVPYSDPLADGPVIQRASERALKGTVTLADCIGIAERAREAGVQIPLILFTYFNPVLQYGLDAFFELVVAKGISGLIIPDLPIEEDQEVRELAEGANIHLIPLVAPTSQDRVKRIASKARGFVYCVSSLGVTGVRADFHSGIEQFLATVREATDQPICIGFGISSREQVARFERICDGVVVGSAIVRQIEEQLPLLQNSDTREQGLRLVGQFVASLKG
ncbi:tryptophan synthase subunit alpha [Paenibacillus sp. PAMC21692]|uniref:tryptophan synthase subunit alpha n=1 Tax=Paenibacillus sp. PAMC21692 TaxID=2762320 RepID=UPI00164D6E90|nr:tryptophan synthase subunit alpha [Paenibacillus sp. PAMC21692]QNK55354.1 tryptophan synthase subunit alpha [Paenibacillus sp. PAMC21692]